MTASTAAKTPTGKAAGTARRRNGTAPSSNGAGPAGRLPLTAIDPDHWDNPRGDVDTASPAFTELVASIEAQGILEPVVVGPPLLDGGRHPIVAGWRRYTAAAAAGLPDVPVHQRHDITDARAALLAALAENMAREDMTPIAEAQAIAMLVEHGDTQVQAAAALGVSERTARERLRLLTLPPKVRDAIGTGEIPSTAGRQLQVIADASPQTATKIAQKLKAGDVTAGALADSGQTAALLRELCGDPKCELLSLEAWVYASRLPVADKKTRQALQDRVTAATQYSGALRINDTSTELLQRADAAGRLLVLHGKGHGGVPIKHRFLAGAEFVGAAIEEALAKAEQAAADHAKQRARQQAKQAKTVDQDQAVKLEREHQAAQAKIDAHAAPHAAAMNAELGRALRGMGACSIEGPVAAVIMQLLVQGEECFVDEIATHGYQLVDPAHPICADDEYGAVKRHVDGLGPEQAAAFVIGACIAFAFADRRAADAGGRGRWISLDDMLPLLRVAADKLMLLRGRAKRYADAVVLHAAADAYHDREGDRRRLLLELAAGARAGVEPAALLERCREYNEDAHAQGASPRIHAHGPADRGQAALSDLVDRGLVAIVKRTVADGTAERVRISPEGRKALKAAPAAPPLFPDIDEASP